MANLEITDIHDSLDAVVQRHDALTRAVQMALQKGDMSVLKELVENPFAQEDLETSRRVLEDMRMQNPAHFRGTSSIPSIWIANPQTRTAERVLPDTPSPTDGQTFKVRGRTERDAVRAADIQKALLATVAGKPMFAAFPGRDGIQQVIVSAGPDDTPEQVAKNLRRMSAEHWGAPLDANLVVKRMSEMEVVTMQGSSVDITSIRLKRPDADAVTGPAL